MKGKNVGLGCSHIILKKSGWEGGGVGGGGGCPTKAADGVRGGGVAEAAMSLDGVGPDDLNVDGLIARMQSGKVREVIIATNATVEGQTTAHYITDRLASQNVQISRLAHGVPVGGELDYLDEGTLTAALRSRTTI